MTPNTTPAPAVQAEQNKHDRVVAMAGEMARRFETHTGVSWIASDWRHESALWAAAWNAALSVQPVPDAPPALGASPAATALSAPAPSGRPLQSHGAEYDDEVIPRLPLGQVWCCGQGCGNCRAVLRPYEYFRRETLTGELIESRTFLRAVSHCCKAPLLVWDEANDCEVPTPNFARGIDSPEGVETQGSTAQPQEPGGEATRPDESSAEQTAQLPQAEPSDAEDAALWRTLMESSDFFVARWGGGHSPDIEVVNDFDELRAALKQQEQTR